MRFTGVSVDTLLGIVGARPDGTHVLAFSHTGYTTNLPLADVTDGKVWIVWEVGDAPPRLPHRKRRSGPVRRLGPVTG